MFSGKFTKKIDFPGKLSKDFDFSGNFTKQSIFQEKIDHLQLLLANSSSSPQKSPLLNILPVGLHDKI